MQYEQVLLSYKWVGIALGLFIVLMAWLLLALWQFSAKAWFAVLILLLWTMSYGWRWWRSQPARLLWHHGYCYLEIGSTLYAAQPLANAYMSAWFSIIRCQLVGRKQTVAVILSRYELGSQKYRSIISHMVRNYSLLSYQ